MAEEDLSSYESGHVYILDVCGSEEESGDFTHRSEHDQNNKNIHRLFTKHFDYEIHSVSFPPRSKPDVLNKYFKEELKDKAKDDLIIVYFHGGGGDNGEEYSWRFSHYPKKEIDAYEVIETIINANVDCMLLLDCYIPDRFHDKWRPGAGNVEIIATGQPLQTADGKLVNSTSGTFTTCLVTVIDGFVKGIKKTYENYHAPKSIPDLLAMPAVRTRLSFNTRRIWTNKPKKTKKANKTVVKRFVALPDDIRQTGKMRFFAKQLQGPDTSGLLEESEGEICSDVEELHEDEGVGEDMAAEGQVGEAEGQKCSAMGQNGESGLLCSPTPGLEATA